MSAHASHNMPSTNHQQLLGVDTGGTFTDFVLLDGDGSIRIHKVLSTPAAPEKAILQGIDELGLLTAAKAGNLAVVHGSTVATNAALEGKGVRTAYITNRGFADVLTIGRQARRELYNLQPTPVDPPVPFELCLETGGRLAANGELIEPLTAADLTTLREQLLVLKPRAVAINLLFSFLDSQHEEAIEAAIPKGIFISRSSFVLPEYKEYERGMATWLNAWLGPLVADYLANLKSALAPAAVAVMQSSGGTIAAEQAASRAVNMLLSGPAGGLAAAKFIGELIAQPKMMTFDMGGTSTDVALIDGDIRLTSEGKIGHYPVAVPMVDMHTIGAGGGSIAYIDSGGMLRVGPESAGADPGPACYVRGGNRPTVTDANAVLGRLRPDAFLGGTMTLDIKAAQRAINTIAQPLGLTIEAAADGIVQIANEHMIGALRAISVQKGYDPAEFTLTCFGGAGGLHVCALADALEMRQILVPIHGGVLSAFGMLVAPRERQLSRTHTVLLENCDDGTINAMLTELAGDGMKQLETEGIKSSAINHHPSLDLRYKGQSYTLNIPWLNCLDACDAFHRAHEQRYGHKLSLPVELVNVRLGLQAPQQRIQLPEWVVEKSAQGERIQMPGQVNNKVTVYRREELPAGQVINGPALLTETIATTWIAQGWRAQIDAIGHLRIARLEH